MKFYLTLLILWGASLAISASPPSADGMLGGLLEELAAQASETPARRAAFTEERWFKFRNKPVILTGLARIDSERGVSIAYPEKEIALLIDEQGMALRKFKGDSVGKDRELDEKRGELALALGAVFRFDLEAIKTYFEVSPLPREAGWALSFVPLPDALDSLETIVVSGEDALVREIEVSLKGERRVVIKIESSETLDTFEESEYLRYFRKVTP